MYRLIAKDSNFKTVLVTLEHNNLNNIQGGDGYSYFHVDEDEYNFVEFSALTAPSADGYLLYSSVTGLPIWTEQIDVVAEHNLLLNLMGGSFNSYYHMTSFEHLWLTTAYGIGYWIADFGGTGNNSYSVGDFLFYNASLTVLNIGNEDDVLVVSGGLPAWQELIITTNHNNLEEIQGGEVDGYYHLTESEHDWLIDGYNNGWVETKGGTGNDSYDPGDILYSNAINSLDKLPIGNEEEILQIKDFGLGPILSWENIEHNEFDDIQGGEVDGYYHLTESEHDWLTDGYNNGWVEIKGGTGNDSYDPGDILYSNAINSLDKLPIGNEEEILQIKDFGLGPVLSWENIEHNEINNIQGGEVDGYYHLTSSEHTWLTDGYNNSWLESQGGTGETSYDLGDLLIGDSSTGLTVLSTDQDGYQLSINQNDIEWNPGYYKAVFVGKPHDVDYNFDGYLLTSLETSSTEDFPAFIVPINSVIRNLRVRLSKAPGSTENIKITIRVNNEDTSLTTTINDTDLTGNNLTESLIVDADDKITVRVQTSNAAFVEDLSVVFLVYSC